MSIFKLAVMKKLGGGGSGDVTIKNQDKNITENGTYTADEGYTGLGTVTVEVPTSGGDKSGGLISKTSWNDLLDSGAIVIEDGAVSAGYVLPDNLPEKNEYGFYYGVKYDDTLGSQYVFYADGSVDEYYEGEICDSYPAGTAIYSANHIEVADWGDCYILDVVDDGLGLVDANGDCNYTVGSAYLLSGDLILIDDNSLFSIKDSGFSWQTKLNSIKLPDSITTIGTGAFRSCYNLTSVIFGNGVTSIGNAAFSDCYNLISVVFSRDIATIDGRAFGDCTSMEVYDFTACTAIPTLLWADAFSNIPSTCQIRVPASLYDEWIAATNWSNYADNIVAV